MNSNEQDRRSDILTVSRLSKSFGGLKAVNDVSFNLKRGQILSLIGPNGAGKTTIFNLITGIIEPTSGTILFENKSINGLLPHQIFRLGISRTFQNVRLFHEMTVLENVLVGLNSKTRTNVATCILNTPKVKKEREGCIKSAMQLLSKYDLEHIAHEKAKNLPYGSQKWVEIVRALASQPKLLFLDEPAAGLNDSETKHMVNSIRAISDETDITILLIEHDMKMVMNISDHVVVLDHGEIICEGKPNYVVDDCKVIEAYLGKKREINRVTG